MRIPPIATPPVRRATPAAGRGPASPTFPSEPAAAPGGTSPAPPTASVATLVALAAIDDDRERRRRNAEQAVAGLDALEALDAELSTGEPSEARLREIASWSASVEPPEDPQLAAILADIDLRAQVELAKYERARDEK